MRLDAGERELNWAGGGGQSWSGVVGFCRRRRSRRLGWTAAFWGERKKWQLRMQLQWLGGLLL